MRTNPSLPSHWHHVTGVVCVAAAACLPAAQHAPKDEPPPIEEPAGPRVAVVSHDLVPVSLAPAEARVDCYSWTPNNEAPLYVSAVEFANLGSFHHSNWFVVPDTVYEGADGPWACDDRDFDPIAAAQSGTVLFSQSTLTWNDRMALGDGIVVRIPARSRFVGEIYLRNATTSTRETSASLTLEVVHPYDVETVLVPLQLAYLDLAIPAASEARFRTTCPPPEFPVSATAPPVTVHYMHPYYHAAGNYFDLKLGLDPVVEEFTVHGFDGRAVGHTFDPPVVLDDGPVLAFTCGYRNLGDEPLVWGTGHNEVCAALLFVDAVEVYYGVVPNSDETTTMEDGIAVAEGTCLWRSTLRGLAYSLPTREEQEAPLIVPPEFDVDGSPPPPPECEDASVIVGPSVAPSLDVLRERVLAPSCAFSGCHGDAAAAGLNFRAEDLAAELLDHETQGPLDLRLVVPGDPEASLLYQVLSQCEPGDGVAHMPKNTPLLLPDEAVAIVFAWINAGAPA